MTREVPSSKFQVPTPKFQGSRRKDWMPHSPLSPSRRLEREKPVVQDAKRPKTTGTQPTSTFHLHRVLKGREKPSPALCAIVVAKSRPSCAHPGHPLGSRCFVSSIRWFSLAGPRFTTGSFLACLRHAFTGDLTIGAVKSAKGLVGVAIHVLFGFLIFIAVIVVDRAPLRDP